MHVHEYLNYYSVSENRGAWCKVNTHPIQPRFRLLTPQAALRLSVKSRNLLNALTHVRQFTFALSTTVLSAHGVDST